jgi:two-component system, response regulator
MNGKQRKILLIEDDPDDRLITKDAFHFIDKNIKIETVDNGESALHLLLQLQKEEYPSLILLDYNVPRLNGLETLKLLQSNPLYNKIPMAILTTSRDPLYRQKSLENGAGKFYVKPLVYSELVAIARELLQWSGNEEGGN